MKLKHLILFLAVFLAACSTRHPVETRQGTSLPNNMVCQQLQAIDSLLWQHPDSALMVLVDFAGSPQADSLSAFDGHYFQILLSELLYKNDYEQTNREELLKAVDYFDSIVVTDGRDAMNRVSTDNTVFLDARAHYINGVGYYEQDSVVDACTEYLKTVEIMESHYKTENLAGKKAQFMGLTFNRLFDLFSEQYMAEPAIGCAQQALAFFRKTDLSAYGVPNIMYWMGVQFAVMDKIDSAEYYYAQALNLLSDTTNLCYRNLRSSMALNNYLYHHQTAIALQTLKRMAAEADDEDEKLTRYYIIGDIYYREGFNDSALRYLQPVFDRKTDLGIRLEAAEHLSKIYGSLGEHAKEDASIRFMAQYKSIGAETKSGASKLSTLYQDYANRKQQRQAEAEQKSAQQKAVKRTLFILIPIVLIVLLILALALRKRQRNRLKTAENEAKQQLEATRQQLDEQLQQQQTEASKKLDEAEKRFEQQKAQTEALKLEMVKQKEAVSEKKSDKGEAFFSEPVCLKIRDSVLLRSITTRDLPVEHKEVVLDEAAGLQFCSVVNQHFGELESQLRERYPRIKSQDLLLCYLHLLNLEEKQMAALLNLTYGAVKKKTARLQEYLKTDENLTDFMKRQAGLR